MLTDPRAGERSQHLTLQLPPISTWLAVADRFGITVW
jgi:hypothetical protein